MNWIAPRPKYRVLKSINGNLLPSLDNALSRYFEGRLEIKTEMEVSLVQTGTQELGRLR